MKTPCTCSIGGLLALAALATTCRADNPIVQTKFTADPAPIVVGDTVAAPADGSVISLRLDSETGVSIGTLNVASTGAADQWKAQSCKISGARGVHDLYLKFFGSGTPLMNLDWWKFEQ